MSLALGLCEAYARREQSVEYIIFGPGGYVMACLERLRNTQCGSYTAVLSIWAMKNGMACVGKIPLCINDSLVGSSSIVWHSSGNYVYVVDQGVVYLVKVRWINTQFRKTITLAEVYSSFLSDPEMKYGSFSTALTVSSSLSDLKISSVQLVDDSKRCLLGSNLQGCIYSCNWNLELTCLYITKPSYVTLKANKPIQFSFEELSCEEYDGLSLTTRPCDEMSTAAPTPFFRVCRGVSKSGQLVPAFTSSASLVLFQSPPADRSSRIHVSTSPCFRLVFPTTDYGPMDDHSRRDSSKGIEEVWSRNNNTLWKVYDSVCFDADSTSGDMYIAALAHRERHTGSEQNLFLSRPGRIIAAVELVVILVSKHAPAIDKSDDCHGTGDSNEFTDQNRANSTETYSIKVVSRVAVDSNIESLSVCSSAGRGQDLPTALKSSSIHVVQSQECCNASSYFIVMVGTKVMCYPFTVLAGRSPPARQGPRMNPMDIVFSIDIGRSSCVISSSISTPGQSCETDTSDHTAIAHAELSCLSIGAGKLVISTSLLSSEDGTSDHSTSLSSRQSSSSSSIHVVSLLVDPVGSSLCRAVSSGCLLDLCEGCLMLFGSNHSPHHSFSLGQSEGYEEPFLHDNRSQGDLSGHSSHDNEDEIEVERESHGASAMSHSHVEGVSVYPAQGYPPYHLAKLPRSLLHDTVLNGLRWRPATNTSSREEGGIKYAGSALCGGQGGVDTTKQGCGLIVARQSDGEYLACALSNTSLIETLPAYTQSKVKEEAIEGSVMVWLYNSRTTKWKTLLPPAFPASQSSVFLLPFRGNLSRSFGVSARNGAMQAKYTPPHTRKLYVDSRPTLVNVKGIQWFSNHSLCLCTVRRNPLDPSTEQHKHPNDQSFIDQSCIELMSRASSSAPPLIAKRSSHRIPGVNADSRRLSSPAVHRVIPLPIGFVPEFMDVISSSVHLSRSDDMTIVSGSTISSGPLDGHGYEHRASTTNKYCYIDEDVVHLRRSINRRRSGEGFGSRKTSASRRRSHGDSLTLDTDSDVTKSEHSSVVLLLGSATHFMAFHITATQSCTTQHTSPRSNDTSGFFGTTKKFKASLLKATHTGFVPTTYEIALLWEIDLRNDVKFVSPTISGAPLTTDGICYPIASALALLHGDTSSTNTDRSCHGSVASVLDATLNTEAGGVSRARAFSHQSSASSEDFRGQNIYARAEVCNDDVGMVVTDAAGKVIEIVLVSSGVTQQEWRGRVVSTGRCSGVVRVEHNLLPRINAPVHMQHIFLLLSSPGSIGKSGRDLLWLPADDSLMDTSLPGGGSVLLAPRRQPGSMLVSLPSDNECIFLTHKAPMKLLNTYGGTKSGEGTAPTAVLQGSFIPLALVIGLLNIHPRHTHSSSSSGETLLDHVAVPFHTYNSMTMGWVKCLLSHTSLHPGPLRRLTNGVEMTLKKIIDKAHFTRHSSDFAVLCSVLFACDDVLFIEVLSRLSRKLEPTVSAELFPLPNCRLSFVRSGYKLNSLSPTLHREHYNLHSENAYRSVKVGDSPWDQLTIFELCLVRGSLSHAARFLTLACEQLGGAQSMESIAASLILSSELLFECLRNMSLENAMECLDFCVRLDVMAAEVSCHSKTRIFWLMC